MDLPSLDVSMLDEDRSELLRKYEALTKRCQLLDKDLVEHKELIDTLNRELSEQEESLIKLKIENVERGEWGLSLDAELIEERARLIKMMQSSSWRITWPLRESMRFILNPKQQLKSYAMRLTRYAHQILALSRNTKPVHNDTMDRTDVPDKSEVIFIIFGSPRSGTTLLKETLSRNSNIFIPHETNIVTPIAYIIESIKNPIIGKELIGKLIVSSKDYQHALGQHLDESEIFHALQYGKYTLAGVLNSIYGTLAKKMNKKRCGDKSPNDLQSVHLLQELGLLDSDIKIIHLVRDVRSVVASLLNVDWAPKDIELTFPRQWNTTNMHLYQAMQGNANYFLLRYEDMVAYPKESFAGACQFLDVKFEEGMLSELNRGVSLRRRQAHHKNLAQPFLTSRVNYWETELPSDIIKHTEQLADEGLSLFGYQKTFQ